MISKLSKSTFSLAADHESAAPLSLSFVKQDRATSALIVKWHLLSLDAPTVAILWTVFTAMVTHTKMTVITPIALGLTVWVLYASDRLLDTRHLVPSGQSGTSFGLEPRHFFHHRHRTAFARTIAGCIVVLAGLVPLLPQAALRLDLIEGTLLATYFLLIHAGPGLKLQSKLKRTTSVPKELLVGPFFAAATFIPTVAHEPGLRLKLVPLAMLFAALCSLNCLYIYAWEHPTSDGSHWTTTYSVRNLSGLTAVLLTMSLLCLLFTGPANPSLDLRLYPIACATSALLLVAIHRLRHHMSPLVLRSVADLALLTPLLFLPFLFRDHA